MDYKRMSELAVKAGVLKEEADYIAPDGSEIRLLLTTKGGGLCHCTLPSGKTSSPVSHQNIEEIGYTPRGKGKSGARLPEPKSLST